MICYGTNAGFGFGGSNLCAGLACKLAVPGCTTDAFGGNCVGTVVAFGDKSAVSPSSQRYIGAPCLDATPSDTTLDEQGNPAGISGVYMGKLWTICDCADNSGVIETPAQLLVNLTATSIGNVTKNDVLLAISQVLPKVNLSDALNATRTTELFPSFTDFFKMPQLPSIQLPSILSQGSNSSEESVQIKLPDLGQLLGSLAAKGINATAQVNKAVDGVAASDSSSSSSDTPSSSPEAPKIKLPDLGKLLSSFTAKAGNASRSSSSVAEPAVSAPVSVASVPEADTSSPPSSSSSSDGSSSDASKTQAEALENWKEFLGNLKSIIPNLNNANITASSSTSSSDAPAADTTVAAAYSDPAAAPVSDAAAAAAAPPADKPEAGTLLPEPTAAAPAAEAVPAAAQPAEQNPEPAAAAAPTPTEQQQQATEPAAAAAPAEQAPVESTLTTPAAEATQPAADATQPVAAPAADPAAAGAVPSEPAPAAVPEAMPAPAPRRFTGFSSTFRAVDQIVNTPGMLPLYDPAYQAEPPADAAAAETQPAAAAVEPAAAAPVAA
jgi:hypothetical protein